ncbi:hypothetical protein SAMN06265795_103139 [Noviherbaspirillum humi]|uniref:Uncharacterized protein n=1 Tax=Noviherbaspirillum humi TaxID=1688639 RepID=A0A239F2D0_9BURK|nr:DUF5985 family protein [Noviherbaspirillum humi]SNS50995.1 hypothetical protein SAMN06265795_103139 [Noviherbaspirillum humi]
MNQMLAGAIAMAWLIPGVFFLRFWTVTRDRFFLFFAAAFIIESANRVFFWQQADITEDLQPYYLIRLAAYVLILIAILDKNRKRD